VALRLPRIDTRQNLNNPSRATSTMAMIATLIAMNAATPTRTHLPNV
jgi:hypothetical protein